MMSPSHQGHHIWAIMVVVVVVVVVVLTLTRIIKSVVKGQAAVTLEYNTAVLS